jgi:hypothetical protein
MAFYRRRLPHVYQTGQPIFLTWRLQDSLPPNRVFPAEAQTSGQAFAAMDCLLEETRTDGDGIGPSASLAIETIEVGEQVYLRPQITVMPTSRPRDTMRVSQNFLCSIRIHPRSSAANIFFGPGDNKPWTINPWSPSSWAANPTGKP